MKGFDKWYRIVNLKIIILKQSRKTRLNWLRKLNYFNSKSILQIQFKRRLLIHYKWNSWKIPWIKIWWKIWKIYKEYSLIFCRLRVLGYDLKTLGII